MAGLKTVMIIDDHPVYSAGLKGVIECEGKYKVVGEACTAREGLRMAEKLRPDIALVDLRLPDMSGIDLIRRIRKVSENTRMMMVSAYSDIDHVRGAVRAGACGYMVKGSGSKGILKCLDAVAEGKRFMDRALSEEMCGLLTSQGDGESAGKYGNLTSREQEVMQLIVDGLDLKEISAKLGISYKTVSVHRSNIMKKLGLERDMDLARYAFRIGLIDLEVWKYGPG